MDPTTRKVILCQIFVSCVKGPQQVRFNSRSRPRVPDTRHEPEHIPYEEGNDRHGDFHDTEQAFLIKDKETMRGVSTRSER